MSYGQVNKMRSHHPHGSRFKRRSKMAVVRRERYRAKYDAETFDQYKRMYGYED